MFYFLKMFVFSFHDPDLAPRVIQEVFSLHELWNLLFRLYFKGREFKVEGEDGRFEQVPTFKSFTLNKQADHLLTDWRSISLKIQYNKNQSTQSIW